MRIFLWLLVGLPVVILLLAGLCYRLVFYAAGHTGQGEEFSLPDGEAYVPYREQMRAWAAATRELPCEHMTVQSFDGLRLHGKFYEYAPGAPIELMFHGYRGSAERDLCGGVCRCFAQGRSALLVDQRTSGGSDGHTITFGILEKRDCLTWLSFMQERFGPDVPIILTGISMGAATVLMAAGEPLPANVVGVLADCGYTSARDIIRSVMKRWPLVPLLYPFVRLGARLFGGFDLEEDSPREAMERCRVPVIFFHGEADHFVPPEMSRENYEHCAARKAIYTVPGAAHGLSFPADQEGYLNALREFFPEYCLAVGETRGE